jgi:hypothetical protein
MLPKHLQGWTSGILYNFNFNFICVIHISLLATNHAFYSSLFTEILGGLIPPFVSQPPIGHSVALVLEPQRNAEQTQSESVQHLRESPGATPA